MGIPQVTLDDWERCPVCGATWGPGDPNPCICMPQYTGGVSLVERAVLYPHPSNAGDPVFAAAKSEAEKMGVDFTLFKEPEK